MWTSPNDPGLNNLINCTNDSIFCSFQYNDLVFGNVTACEGDTFIYIVGSMPGENVCFQADTVLFDTTFVIVFPEFTVEIDSSCNAIGDSLILTADVLSAAVGCDYAFIWSNGDTTQSITVPF